MRGRVLVALVTVLFVFLEFFVLITPAPQSGEKWCKARRRKDSAWLPPLVLAATTRVAAAAAAAAAATTTATTTAAAISTMARTPLAIAVGAC